MIKSKEEVKQEENTDDRDYATEAVKVTLTKEEIAVNEKKKEIAALEDDGFQIE